jgi:hypothetical protein
MNGAIPSAVAADRTGGRAFAVDAAAFSGAAGYGALLLAP